MFIDNNCGCCKEEEDVAPLRCSVYVVSRNDPSPIYDGRYVRQIDHIYIPWRAGIVYFVASSKLIESKFIIRIDNSTVIDTGFTLSYSEWFIKREGVEDIYSWVYSQRFTSWSYKLCCPVIETCDRNSWEAPSFAGRWRSYIVQTIYGGYTYIIDPSDTLERLISTATINPETCAITLDNFDYHNCCEGCDSRELADGTTVEDYSKCCKTVGTNLCCQNECCFDTTGATTTPPRGQFTENGYCCPDTLPFCYLCVDDSFFDKITINTLMELNRDDWFNVTTIEGKRKRSCNLYINEYNAIRGDVSEDQKVTGLHPSTIYKVYVTVGEIFYREISPYIYLWNRLDLAFYGYSVILKINNEEYNFKYDKDNWISSEIYFCDIGDSLDIEFVSGDLLMYNPYKSLSEADIITVPIDSFTGPITTTIYDHYNMPRHTEILYGFRLIYETFSACGCGPVGDNPLP